MMTACRERTRRHRRCPQRSDSHSQAAAAAAPVGEKRYPTRVKQAPGEWWKGQKPVANMAKVGGDEPATYEEALASPDAELWGRAMNKEMASLISNGTWTLESVPEGVKPIPVKWVYKIRTRRRSTWRLRVPSRRDCGCAS